MTDVNDAGGTGKSGWTRALPLMAILLVGLVGAFTLRDVLSFEMLNTHREKLMAYRDAHYLGTVAAFMAIYVVIVGFSLPGATVATLTGGFLFGTFPGVVFNVGAATIGAVVIFLAARWGLGERLAARMDASGAVIVQTSITEQGQGSEAVIQQVTASAFGTTPDKVKVISGDTDNVPVGWGAGGSGGAGIAGEAALQAAKALRHNVLDVAGWRALADAMNELSDRDDVLAVAVRGTGGRAFSAGSDIGAFADQRVATGRARIFSGAGAGHRLAPLFQCKPRGDQAARPCRRLDQHQAGALEQRQPVDHTVLVAGLSD